MQSQSLKAMGQDASRKSLIKSGNLLKAIPYLQFRLRVLVIKVEHISFQGIPKSTGQLQLADHVSVQYDATSFVSSTPRSSL